MRAPRPVLMIWIMLGVVLGASGALLGAGGTATAQACTCVVSTDVGVFAAADVDVVDQPAVAVVAPVAVPDTTLPTDSPTSDKNSTAGLLVLIGVVAIVGTGAIVLTLKYRKR